MAEVIMNPENVVYQNITNVESHCFYLTTNVGPKAHAKKASHIVGQRHIFGGFQQAVGFCRELLANANIPQLATTQSNTHRGVLTNAAC